jgi:hypothetical protein
MGELEKGVYIMAHKLSFEQINSILTMYVKQNKGTKKFLDRLLNHCLKMAEESPNMITPDFACLMIENLKILGKEDKYEIFIKFISPSISSIQPDLLKKVFQILKNYHESKNGETAHGKTINLMEAEIMKSLAGL